MKRGTLEPNLGLKSAKELFGPEFVCPETTLIPQTTGFLTSLGNLPAEHLYVKEMYGNQFGAGAERRLHNGVPFVHF